MPSDTLVIPSAEFSGIQGAVLREQGEALKRIG